MTKTGANLPEAILKRIEAEKEEAYRSEIRDIEARISAGIDRHLEDRQKWLDSRVAELNREITAASERELAELQKVEAEIVESLHAEADRRRSERLKGHEDLRNKRILDEKEEAKRAATDLEEKKQKAAAAAADPALRVRTLLKQIKGHMERGDMEVASGALAEALKLDAFNAELIDLDAKLREARESDTFAAPVDSPTTDKKAIKKADKKLVKSPNEKIEKAQQDSATTGTIPAGRKKFPSWILSAVATLLITIAAVIVYVEYAPRHLSASTTVAVLPWTNSGNQPSTGVLAEALPEIVLKLLSRDSAQIDLLGYSTTMNLSRISEDPVASLTSLGYSHFLRGHIGGTDSMFTVHIELTDSVGTTLWFNDFKRNSADIVLLPFEITHSLNRYFGLDVAGPPAVIELENSEAYFFYLKGLASSHLPDGTGLDDAINSFSRSLALDSTLAVSHAGLAWALIHKYSWISSWKKSLLDDASASATDAIRLAPMMSDGYLAMARINIEKKLYQDALALLDSSARLSPRDSRIPFLRGLAFFRSGQTELAIDLLQKAFRLDPRNTEILGQLAIVRQIEKSFERALWYRETAMFFSGDSSADLIGPISDILALDPALRLSQGNRVTSACLRALERNPREYPTLYSLARMLQVSGDIQEANKYLRSLESNLRRMVRSKTADTRARMYLGLTLTRMGKYAEGLAIAESAAAANPGNTDAKYYLARIYSLQMNSPQTKTVNETTNTRALDLLREALNERFDNNQLGSADFYNVYSKHDIRRALTGGTP